MLASAPDEVLEGSTSAKETQRQSGKEVRVAAKVKATEALSAEATGRIEIGPKSYELKPVTAGVAAGKAKTLELQPKKAKHEKKILEALKRDKPAEARLKVKLSDEAGNTQTDRFSVALKG